MKKTKSIDDRSNMIRIPYNTEDKSPSSITIDETTFLLIQAQFGQAKEWFKDAARQKRSELLKHAEELAAQNTLYKSDNHGNKQEITPDEFIRGKISAAVREEAIMAIANPELLAKLAIKN